MAAVAAGRRSTQCGIVNVAAGGVGCSQARLTAHGQWPLHWSFLLSALFLSLFVNVSIKIGLWKISSLCACYWMVNNFKSILSSLLVYCTSDSEVQRALTKSGWGDWDQIFEITLFSPTYQNSSSGYLIKIQRYQRVKAIKTIFLNIKGIFVCTWIHVHL